MNVDPKDPFGERRELGSEVRLQIAGAELVVRSSDRVLIDLAVEAFGSLPRFATEGAVPDLRLQLTLNDREKSWQNKPPPPTPGSGDGLLCGVVDSGNYAIVDPENRRAIVSVSRAMLHHPHLARYELIEFAVLTLAGRALSLVPLHGACVGLGETGCLLVGATGAGKSTLCLLALSGGLQVLSEDSVFVSPRDLSVFGMPNFLHLRPDALGLLDPGPVRDRVSDSPTIHRRSGVEKFAYDYREHCQWKSPLRPKLGATVFLSEKIAEASSALRPLEATDELITRLRSEQPYAAGLPEWSEFSRKISAVRCFELRRTESPGVAVEQLRTMLAGLSGSK